MSRHGNTVSAILFPPCISRQTSFKASVTFRSLVQHLRPFLSGVSQALNCMKRFMLMSGQVPQPLLLDLLPLIADHLLATRSHGTLAACCRLDKSTRHLLLPKLYRVLRLETAKSIGIFFDTFRHSVRGCRWSPLLNVVKHIEIELNDQSTSDPAFPGTIGQPFGMFRSDIGHPNGLFPNLETLHIITSSRQNEIRVRIGDPPSIPVIVGRLLGCARTKHLRWVHHFTEAVPSLLEKAAWFTAIHDELAARGRDGALSEEVPVTFWDWPDHGELELQFMRVNVQEVIENSRRFLILNSIPYNGEVRRRPVIYANCSSLRQENQTVDELCVWLNSGRD